MQYARSPAASLHSSILNHHTAHFSRRVAGGAGTEAALTGYSIYVAYSSSPRMSPSSFELYAQVPTQLDEPVSQAQCQPRDSFFLPSPYSLSSPASLLFPFCRLHPRSLPSSLCLRTPEPHHVFPAFHGSKVGDLAAASWRFAPLDASGTAQTRVNLGRVSMAYPRMHVGGVCLPHECAGQLLRR